MVAELADSGVNIHIDFSQFRTAPQPPPPPPLVSEGADTSSPTPLSPAPAGSPSKAHGKGSKKGNRAAAASPTPPPPQLQAAQRTAPQVLAAKLAEKITEANVGYLAMRLASISRNRIMRGMRASWC